MNARSAHTWKAERALRGHCDLRRVQVAPSVRATRDRDFIPITDGFTCEASHFSDPRFRRATFGAEQRAFIESWQISRRPVLGRPVLAPGEGFIISHLTTAGSHHRTERAPVRAT